MRVLIIKNVGKEGPGTIEDYLKVLRATYQIINLYEGEKAPDPSGFSHLVVMGGPMAVYEMDRYPFLKDEAVLIERAIKSELHVLGICLGAQMIAHVLGARVYPGKIKEVGWYDVTLTADGMKDTAISQLSSEGDRARVFQWHGDTFDLPRGAVRLASSELYENQAFRYSNGVYALQFHIEVTPDIIREWFREERDFNLEEMILKTERLFQPYHRRAKNFYSKFFTLRYSGSVSSSDIPPR
jgi:GMP synthase (glutamine-hydrolysing)